LETSRNREVHVWPFRAGRKKGKNHETAIPRHLGGMTMGSEKKTCEDGGENRATLTLQKGDFVYRSQHELRKKVWRKEWLSGGRKHTIAGPLRRGEGVHGRGCAGSPTKIADHAPKAGWEKKVAREFWLH